MGLPSPKPPRRGALRKKIRLGFLALFVGRTTLLISFLERMSSIDFWNKNAPPQLPIVLTHPFPLQPQNVVAKNLSPPQGGMESTPHHEGSSSNSAIFMCDQTINLQTQAKNYDIYDSSHTDLEATHSFHPGGPLHIENPSFDAPHHPPKCFIQ
jgi:hypothetical protein